MENLSIAQSVGQELKITLKELTKEFRSTILPLYCEALTKLNVKRLYIMEEYKIFSESIELLDPHSQIIYYSFALNTESQSIEKVSYNFYSEEFVINESSKLISDKTLKITSKNIVKFEKLLELKLDGFIKLRKSEIIKAKELIKRFSDEDEE
jgi:hypothetical protein